MSGNATHQPSKFYGWLRTVHLWMTLILGLPIVVVCVTGAILVGVHQYQRLFDPAGERIAAAGAPLSHGRILARIAAQRPDIKVWGLMAADRPDMPWTAWLAGGGGVLKLDPYNGDILRQFRPRQTFEGWVAALHRRWLVDGGWSRTARAAVSAATLALMIQVVLGLWIWLARPGRLRRLAVAPGQPTRVLILRLHNLAGVITAGFILLICFTGIAMFWHESARTVIETLTGSRIADDELPPFDTLAPIADLDGAITLGAAALPEARLRGVRPPARPGQPAILNFDVPGQATVAHVWVGDAPPRVLAVHDGRGLNAATRFWRMRGRLHAGDFGLATSLIWMLMSLMPVGFIGTGLWLYWRRWRDGRASRAGADAA